MALPLVAAACSARAALTLPTGAGVPAPHAQAAWAEASTTCRALSSYRAEFGLTGQVGSQRIRGLASARLNAALTREGSIGLEAEVSGQSVFRLGGTAQSAVLLVRNPNRVVTAPPDEILDALIGVRLGPERLLRVFGGCVSAEEEIVRAADHGRFTEIATRDARMFLEQQAARWRVRAGHLGDIAIEVHRFRGDLPDRIVVRSTRTAGPTVVLDLRIRQALSNTDVPAAAFHVSVPPDARTITIEELRDSGPLVSDAASR